MYLYRNQIPIVMKKSESIEQLTELLKVQEAKETLYYFGVACFGKVEYVGKLQECRDKIKALKQSINLIKSQS